MLVRALLSSLVGDRWLSIRPMTPQVWLDLSPPHTVLYATSADRQIPSGIQRGVALQPFGLACLCVTFLLVVLVPWVGGVGH